MLAVAGTLAAPALARAANPEPTVHPPCNLFVPSVCLLPFPNDLFTVKDASTDTGRRLDILRISMPRNVAQVPIDPTDMNRADGFSPGTPIVVKVPGLETKQAFAATGAVPITDVSRSFDPDQPIVVINAQTLQAPADLGGGRHEPGRPGPSGRWSSGPRRTSPRGRA